jgi:hypothetical protein
MYAGMPVFAWVYVLPGSHGLHVHKPRTSEVHVLPFMRSMRSMRWGFILYTSMPRMATYLTKTRCNCQRNLFGIRKGKTQPLHVYMQVYVHVLIHLHMYAHMISCMFVFYAFYVFYALGVLFSVIGGPCRRYAVTPTRVFVCHSVLCIEYMRGIHDIFYCCEVIWCLTCDTVFYLHVLNCISMTTSILCIFKGSEFGFTVQFWAGVEMVSESLPQALMIMLNRRACDRVKYTTWLKNTKFHQCMEYFQSLFRIY